MIGEIWMIAAFGMAAVRARCVMVTAETTMLGKRCGGCAMAERGSDETKAPAGDATLGTGQAEGACSCAELRAALAAAESRAATAEAALDELK